jgi:putative addiction module component (TIGR02574 family)
MSPAEKLYDEAMKLPDSERGVLALKLLDSTGEDGQEDVERAWLDLACKRLEDIRAGRVETVPWEELERELEID